MSYILKAQSKTIGGLVSVVAVIILISVSRGYRSSKRQRPTGAATTVKFAGAAPEPPLLVAVTAGMVDAELACTPNCCSSLSEMLKTAGWNEC